jgi:putative ATP-binding cassette transporter
MAFSTLVAACSLIVTQFQSLSSYAAVLGRLSSMVAAVETSQATKGSGIEIVEAEGPLAYEGLTLLPPTDGDPVLKELSMTIPFGARLLLTGPNQAAGVAVFRATAGVSIDGRGRIIRPGSDQIMFLAQRPYLPPGTLRQVLEPVAHTGKISDDRILRLLSELGLEQVSVRAGGLDCEQDWATQLSLREQQLLAIIHILIATPRFVFLDRVGTALGSKQMDEVLRMLSESSIAYINSGRIDGSLDLYDAVLECHDDGGWTLTGDAAGRMGATR